MKKKEFYQIDINKKSITFIPVRNYGIDLLKIIIKIIIIKLFFKNFYKLYIYIENYYLFYSY